MDSFYLQGAYLSNKNLSYYQYWVNHTHPRASLPPTGGGYHNVPKALDIADTNTLSITWYSETLLETVKLYGLGGYFLEGLVYWMLGLVS